MSTWGSNHDLNTRPGSLSTNSHLVLTTPTAIWRQSLPKKETEAQKCNCPVLQVFSTYGFQVFGAATDLVGLNVIIFLHSRTQTPDTEPQGLTSLRRNNWKMLWGSEVKQLAGFVEECGAFLRILGNCPSPETHDLRHSASSGFLWTPSPLGKCGRLHLTS